MGFTKAFDIVHRLFEVAKEAEHIHFRELVADLRSELLDARDELHRVRQVNSQLREQMQCTVPNIALRKRGSSYVAEDGTGPFCATCYEGSRKVVRMVEQPRITWNDFGSHKCPECGSRSRFGLE